MKNQKKTFTVDDICKEARIYGLVLCSYECDESYYNQLKTPSLALIRNNHVVVIKKVRKKSIIYYDPEVGKVKLKKTEFFQYGQK